MEDINECRICFLNDNQDDMFTPCLCDGTNKYIHRKCLDICLIYDPSDSCKVCNYKYETSCLVSYEKIKNNIEFIKFFIHFSMTVILIQIYYTIINSMITDKIYSFVETYKLIFIFMHLFIMVPLQMFIQQMFLKSYNAYMDIIVKIIVSICCYNLIQYINICAIIPVNIFSFFYTLYNTSVYDLTNISFSSNFIISIQEPIIKNVLPILNDIDNKIIFSLNRQTIKNKRS